MEKFKILIIDENPNHRDAIRKILLPSNANILETSGGENAFREIENTRPDLVIVKLNSHPLSGVRICEMIREKPDLQDIPVILTGSSEQDDLINKGLSAGAIAYIDKSNAKMKLFSVADKLLIRDSCIKPSDKTILVVDDSHSIRLMLEIGLSKEGYQVITAGDGNETLQIMKTRIPDLILCDVYMPGMNGLELCRILHEDPLYSQIPFVVMSTENDAGNMKHMMRYGAAAFIIKPFNLEQLMMVLNNIFSYQFRLLLKERERLDSEQQLLIAGITSLVKALEARDEYTRGHSDRVAMTLAGLVKHDGGSLAEIDRARIAGRLHDIGKIGIRDNVLLKPDRLTVEEFDHIKQHPIIGASILKAIPSITDIVSVIFSHHERVDGKGYPKGLSDSDIPLWARMTAVADTYDALTSDRPYRKGMPHEKAINIIAEVSGTQLCEKCVNLFFDWCRKELSFKPGEECEERILIE